MAGILELINVGVDYTLNFGNHEIEEKQKVEGFEIEGDIYKVKTHNQVTRLEKNGRLLYESVPGTTVTQFAQTHDTVSFIVEGSSEDAQITVELEADEEFKILINSVQVGKMVSNLSGKISFSVDFASGNQEIAIVKL